MLKAIAFSYVLSFGTILSMIGPGLTTTSYVIHGLIAMMPAGVITAFYFEVKDTFEKTFFDAMAEDLINRK